MAIWLATKKIAGVPKGWNVDVRRGCYFSIFLSGESREQVPPTLMSFSSPPRVDHITGRHSIFFTTFQFSPTSQINTKVATAWPSAKEPKGLTLPWKPQMREQSEHVTVLWDIIGSQPRAFFFNYGRICCLVLYTSIFFTMCTISDGHCREGCVLTYYALSQLFEQ